jgi:ABC-2 type transport system permease protein
MKDFFRVYLTGIFTSIKTALAYRANFLMMNIFDISVTVMGPLVTVLIYGSGASFPGWTFWEVMLMQMLFECAAALNAVFMESIVWATMGHVKEGSLETVLLKPMSPILYMISTNFSANSFGGLFSSFVLIIVAACSCKVELTQIPLCILIFVAGLAVTAAASLIVAAISFKWVANSRLGEIRTSLEIFGRYPVKIFPKGLQLAVTFIIPYAAMGCFPAEILLGRFNPVNTLAVVSAGLFLAFALWLYNHMVKLYEGAGG